MKRITLTLIIFLFSLTTCIFPAAAESFAPSDTDLTIDIDTSVWYVFTQDNLENNPEVSELGFTADELRSLLETNSAFLYALALYAEPDVYIGLTIQKAEEEDIVNLTPHSDYEIKDIMERYVKALPDEYEIIDSSIYEHNYKYMVIDYYDKVNDDYNREYLTVVNAQSYSISFFLPIELSADEIAFTQDIVNTVHFQVDDPDEKSTSSFKLKSVLIPVGSAAVAGGGAALIRLAVNKKRKKRNVKE